MTTNLTMMKPPPNEKLVEVEENGERIQVMAFYGRDGYRPHWTNADRSKIWPVDRFQRWWEIEQLGSEKLGSSN